MSIENKKFFLAIYFNLLSLSFTCLCLDWLNFFSFSDCLTADKRVAICDVGLLGQIELPLVGSFVGIEVSAVSNPVHFYVILPWGTESIKNLNSVPGKIFHLSLIHIYIYLTMVIGCL